MIDDDRPQLQDPESAKLEHRPRSPRGADTPPPARPRLKKRRTLLILIPIIFLAGISTVFGMMMALARDLPDLESAKEFQTARNSTLVDRLGRPLGILTSDRNRVLIDYEDISPFMRNAIIADRGSPLLRERGRRRARHRAAPSTRTWSEVVRVRAARRSRSSSSRTRLRRRTSERSSRSCARRRSPTT